MVEYANKKKQKMRGATSDGNTKDSNEHSIDEGADNFLHPINKDIAWGPDPSKVNYSHSPFKQFLPHIKLFLCESTIHLHCTKNDSYCNES